MVLRSDWPDSCQVETNTASCLGGGQEVETGAVIRMMIDRVTVWIVGASFKEKRLWG